MTSLRSGAIRIVRRIRSSGFEAYFAGGCVRDMLLRQRPKDYDIATGALPDQIEAIFPRTVAVGKSFGVIRVLEPEGEFEVATFRSDGLYSDGRRPESVRFTHAEEDAKRRDFTMNGLFYDPIRSRIVDVVGGRKDLRARKIRCIGQPGERFQEDHLRMIRAVRFAAQLGFQIERNTWKAIGDLAPRIRSVSNERIRDELTKILTSPQPALGLKLLWRSGLLQVILPEVVALRGVQQPRKFHPEGDVWVHTLKLFDYLPERSSLVAWAALLHDIGKPATFEKTRVRGRLRIRFPEHAHVGAEMSDRILTRLKFSNAERDQIVSMVANHMTFKDVMQMRQSTLKRLLARPTIEEELKLHRADCMACHGKSSNYYFLRRQQKMLGEEKIRPPRLLTGKDLIQLGLKPGPDFSHILRQVEDAQLEGEVTTRDEALSLVRKWIHKQS